MIFLSVKFISRRSSWNGQSGFKNVLTLSGGALMMLNILITIICSELKIIFCRSQ